MSMLAWIIIGVLSAIIIVLVVAFIQIAYLAGGLMDAFTGGVLGIIKRKRF